MKAILPVTLALTTVLGLGQLALGQPIANPDFADWAGDTPSGWTVRNLKQELVPATDIAHPAAKSALQVNLVQDGGSGFGEILQEIKFEPYTRYRLSADVRSTKAGIAIVQVKTIRSRSELQRHSSKASTTEWSKLTVEFDTGGADKVQVLCRYRQKAEQVGEKAWWTRLGLEKLGPGAAPPAPGTTVMAPRGADRYVTPLGAGDRTGAGWEHAMAGADGLQTALDAVGPGQTLYIGSGVYRDVALVLKAGGDADSILTIRGVDTGDGLPRMVSDFDPQRPAGSGNTFLRVEPHVGYVAIEHIRLEDVRIGIALNGPNIGVRVTDVDVTRCREGIIVSGAAVPYDSASGTRDLIIRDCELGPYTKRGVRIREGVHDAQIVNCHADAGGVAWATEPFQIGFAIEGSQTAGVSDHDITYVGCTARNNYQDKGDKYWNGDGFVAERNVSKITYRDCGAFDNTDGGWDLKAQNPTLVNCVTLRNKRNFRIWSSAQTPAKLYNCVAAYSVQRGGSGNRNGLHLSNGAGADLAFCTFIDNGQGIDIDDVDQATWVRLQDSLIVDADGVGCVVSGEHGRVTLERSIVVDKDHMQGRPQFVRLNKQWEGGNADFDSTDHIDQGYRFDRKPPAGPDRHP